MSSSNDPIGLGVNGVTVPVSANPIALRSSAIPTVSWPTRLRVPDLLRITGQAADEVLRGRYSHLLPYAGIRTEERWFTRLHSDDEVDVWLISWVPNQATELHDHGGSLGALTLSAVPCTNSGGTATDCAAVGSMPAIRPGSRLDGCTTSPGHPPSGRPR
jgi:hypothetical protein